MTHPATPKRTLRGQRKATVVMVDRETHRRLRSHALATGRKIEWLASQLISRGLENAELN